MSDEASRYRKELDQLPDGHPYLRLRELVTTGTKVLDIGCASGELGAYLTEGGAIVDGIEANPERAALARKRLHHVVDGLAGPDFDTATLAPTYDVVLLADVVEHVVDAEPLLDWVAQRLAPGGAVYCLLPNSAHASFRRRMLAGNWRYEDQGLLDRDHVRFYDVRTMSELTTGTALTETRRWYFPRLRRRRRLERRLVGRWPNLVAYYVLLEWRPRP